MLSDRLASGQAFFCIKRKAEVERMPECLQFRPAKIWETMFPARRVHRTYLQQPISWWKGALLKVELDIFRSFLRSFSPDPADESLEKAGNIAFSHGLKWEDFREDFKLPRTGCRKPNAGKIISHACIACLSGQYSDICSGIYSGPSCQ